MVWVRKHLKDHLIPTLCNGQGCHPICLRSCPTWPWTFPQMRQPQLLILVESGGQLFTSGDAAKAGHCFTSWQCILRAIPWTNCSFHCLSPKCTSTALHPITLFPSWAPSVCQWPTQQSCHNFSEHPLLPANRSHSQITAWKVCVVCGLIFFSIIWNPIWNAQISLLICVNPINSTLLCSRSHSNKSVWTGLVSPHLLQDLHTWL